MKITKENTSMLEYKGSRFELHTNLNIKRDDILEIPKERGFSIEKVVEIKDILTDDDRHHGDIINQHIYFLTIKEI